MLVNTFLKCVSKREENHIHNKKYFAHISDLPTSAKLLINPALIPAAFLFHQHKESQYVSEFSVYFENL